MTYNFKFAQEMVWVAGVAAVTFFLTAFVASSGVTDWRTWVITAGAGAARAAAAAMLALLGPRPAA